jgi:hypothetical protein
VGSHPPLHELESLTKARLEVIDWEAVEEVTELVAAS